MLMVVLSLRKVWWAGQGTGTLLAALPSLPGFYSLVGLLLCLT